MPSLAQGIVMGHLGRDPELRYTSSGAAVVSVSVAVDHQGSENVKEQTDWYTVTLWGKRGETFAKLAHKGDACLFIGRQKFKTWTGQNGEVRWNVDLTVDTWRFAGGGAGRDVPEDQPGTRDNPARPRPEPAQEDRIPEPGEKKAKTGPIDPVDDEDDIPF